jgi:hypothetical protein
MAASDTNGKKRRGRGEGSIEQLPSGKFRAVVSGGIDVNTGKRLSALVCRDRGQF